MNEGEKYPLWSGRFSASPADAFERLNSSIPVDVRLAPYDVRGSIAHATMLGERGIVTPEESAELVRGLEAVLAERSEEHTSELQSRQYLVCRLLLEKKH